MKIRKLFFWAALFSLLLINGGSTAPLRDEITSLDHMTEQEIMGQYAKRTIKEDVLELSKDKNAKAVESLNKMLDSDTQLFSDSSMNRLNKIAEKHDLRPSWIILVLFRESRINPKAVNKDSRSTGVLQFTPATAKSLGTSPKELLDMSVYEQLHYVDKYISALSGKSKYHINSYEDLHLSVFYPKALGKGSDYVIGYEGSRAAEWNKRFKNKDGHVTVSSFRKRI